MGDFLIKSILCQIILIAIYFFILEREKMHQFKRFFLLFCLAFSLGIPFLNIEIQEKVASTQIQNQIIFEEHQILSQNVFATQSVNFLPLFLWSIYGLVTFVLSIRFIINLYKIKKRISIHPKVSFEKATLVLVPENILPHTFLNYIFIPKKDFENSTIEPELYKHELTHARQKHTLDVLFIEILKVVFWFNLILILYKKAIQLNHEFLADENVVSSHNVSFYQNLLLEKASWKNNFHLVSNLNFLVTKKRLLMMTKTTSKNTAVFKKLIFAPFFVGIIYFMCTKTIAQEKENPIEKSQPTKKVPTVDDKEKRRATYFAGVRFVAYDKFIKKDGKMIGTNIIFDKFYEDFTPENKKRWEVWLYTQDGFKKNTPTSNELADFKNANKYAIWIDGKNVNNSELKKFKSSDIAYFSGSVILKNARTKKHPQPFQYWFYTHDYFDKNEMGKEAEKYPDSVKEIFVQANK